MKAQIGGFQQASENANDAVALLATAEGAYNAVSDIMVRMRELAVQASTDTLTDKERAYIGTNIGIFRLKITRISDVTEYNGIKLLGHGLLVRFRFDGLRLVHGTRQMTRLVSP